MRVYKGDLIQRVTVDNIHINNCWGRETMGVTNDADIHPDVWRLFHRPIKNHLKHIIYSILFWLSD